jgi:CRISPR-associated protein Cmr4
MTTKLMFVHAVTPLHAGVGAGTDVIDLPIAREVATGLPYLPGSSIKGSLRSLVQATHAHVVKDMFGPDTRDASDQAGAVQFSDAYLLAIPIRSLAGMFAWVTSPYILQRIARDAALAGLAVPAVPGVDNHQVYVVPQRSKLRFHEQKAVFEDIDLQVVDSNELAAWHHWLGQFLAIHPEFLAERLCIVSDDVLSFLLQTATEVRARIRLTDEKTVQNGALWYEESLPSESLLVGIVHVSPNKKTQAPIDAMLGVLQDVSQSLVQFGGKSTTGHGFCHVVVSQL